MSQPTKMRTFRVAPGAPGDGDRVVILPRHVLAGPGARVARFRSGETFPLPDEAAKHHWVRKRIRAGDITEESAPARAVKEG